MSSWTAPPGAVCKVCGCTEEDCLQCIAKTGRACAWVAEDLCSACVAPHTFDPHPLRPLSCAVCTQTFIPGDPVCQGTPGYLTNEMIAWTEGSNA